MDDTTSSVCIPTNLQNNFIGLHLCEEGRRTHPPKCCEYIHADEYNSPNSLSDKNNVICLKERVIFISKKT